MSRQGVELFNRGSKGINSVISGKIAKQQGGTRYPQGDYPVERYVKISVYEGDLAGSIQGITDGVSKIQGSLQQMVGEGGSKAIGVAKSVPGMAKDAATVFSKATDSMFGSSSFYNRVTSDETDQADQPNLAWNSNPNANVKKPAPQGSSMLGNLGNGVMDIVGGAGSSFQETVDTLNRGHLGNGNVSDHAKSWITDLFLPLPNEIQESMSHNYDEEAGWFGTVKEHIPGVTTGIDAVVDMASIISKMTGSRSITFDKNRVSMYTDSAFRSISLSWSLVPNDQEETKAIQEIVKSLKKYSSPESVSGKILLKSPHFFRIQFGNKLIDDAMQFYEVVITDIGIDYSPGGGMEMHHDDTPKTISLSITFKDREPKLMEDWDKSAKTAAQSEKPGCSVSGSTKPSTSTDSKTGHSHKKAAAGGGSDAKVNSGQTQAAPPQSLEDFNDGSNDLDNEYIDWSKEKDTVNTIYSDSEANPLVGLHHKVDVSKKLPAENPYSGPSLTDYLKG